MRKFDMVVAFAESVKEHHGVEVLEDSIYCGFMVGILEGWFVFDPETELVSKTDTCPPDYLSMN